MGSGVEVRRADERDVPAIADALADAFLDDPALAWAAPRRDARRRHGPAYFAAVARMYLPKGEVHVTSDGLGAALWAPPERWRTSLVASVPMLPAMVRACGTTLPRAMRMMAMMEKRHEVEVEPHFYLPFIGVAARGRGQGRGSALLIAVLERCDAEGRPAYLEATSPANRAVYARHGFEELEELRFPGGGPPFWPMWRRAR